MPVYLPGDYFTLVTSSYLCVPVFYHMNENPMMNFEYYPHASIRMITASSHKEEEPTLALTEGICHLRFDDSSDDEILLNKMSTSSSEETHEEDDDHQKDQKTAQFDDPADSIQQVQLRSGKPLQNLPLKPKSKDKNIITKDLERDQEPDNQEESTPMPKVDYNVLAHLKKLPALLSIYDALMLSPELRQNLIKALSKPEVFQAYFAEEKLKECLLTQDLLSITFADDDLLLKTTDHNRPLYVTATI